MTDFNKSDQELQHLFWKDEILQVIYWMQGEGLGEQVSASHLQNLLSIDAAELSFHLKKLVTDDYLEIEGSREEDGLYSLSDFGKKEAGKRFASAFQGLQKAGHGECSADCDCQWEGHDSCKHHHHH